MKCLGIDYGLARTGLAACDPGGVLAYPLKTLRLEDFSGRKALLDALAALAVSVVGYISTIRRRESTNSERQEASA